MRIASCAFPYARVKRNEAKRHLTAVEFMNESLDVDVKLWCRNEGLETDARSLRCAESIDTDVYELRRRENLEASIRKSCHIPVVPQSSLGGVPSSSTTRQKRAVSGSDEQSVSECSSMPKAALTLPKLPIFSIRATSPRRNSGETQLPKVVVPE